MKFIRIAFWVYAIIMSLGIFANISDNSFDVYQLIVIIQSWLAVYYAESNKIGQ